MRIYLSSYWKKNCISIIIIVSLIIISTTFFCIWSKDSEDYILIACSGFFVILLCDLLLTSMKLVRYVVKDKQQLIMCSFGGKKIASLNLDTEIYYEVLPLIEGTYSKQEFIVLSNLPFVSYGSKDDRKLAKICKSIDKNGNQIIMPYGNHDTMNLLDVSTWHRIISF